MPKAAEPPAPPPPPPPAPAFDAVDLDSAVARFLDDLGLGAVGPILAREEIDWETLGLLDAEGLADTGMSRDDAEFIIGAYQSLNGAAPTPVARTHAPARGRGTGTEHRAAAAETRAVHALARGRGTGAEHCDCE